MGYYIETPSNFGKADHLIAEHGAQMFAGSWDDLAHDQIPVVVLDNGYFEAAGIAYDEDEFKAFTDPSDWRPRTVLALDRGKAIELCPKVAGRIN